MVHISLYYIQNYCYNTFIVIKSGQKKTNFVKVSFTAVEVSCTVKIINF